MLSDKMKQELIVLAQMLTTEEDENDRPDNDDIEIDGQIDLARKVLDDLKIKY